MPLVCVCVCCFFHIFLVTFHQLLAWAVSCSYTQKHQRRAKYNSYYYITYRTRKNCLPPPYYMVYPTVWAESKDGKLIKRIWMSSVCAIIVWASHLRVFSLPASNRHKPRVNDTERLGHKNETIFYSIIPFSLIYTFSLLLTFFYSTYLHVASSRIPFSLNSVPYTHLERESKG